MKDVKPLTLHVTNSGSEKIIFRLEPWGDEQELLPRETVLVSVTGANVLEIEHEQSIITLYGGEGSLLEIENRPM